MSTTEVMPAIEVAASPVVPYPFGLLSLAPTAPPLDVHWQSGAWWRSDGCASVGVTYAMCDVDAPIDQSLTANVSCDIVAGRPFTVYARSAESMGGASKESKFAAARSALIAGEQRAIESVLWALMIAATPVDTGSSTRTLDGFAQAEAQIGKVYNGTPVLHVGRYGATLASELLSSTGGRLTTTLGSAVVAGNGYDIAQDAHGEPFTIFGTGAVSVMRSEVFDVGEHYDRQTNEISAVVERTYVIGYDCALVEVTVTPA